MVLKALLEMWRHRYLWTQPGWVLVGPFSNDSELNAENFAIFNIDTASAYIVEDPITCTRIMKRMKEEGVEILSAEELRGRV